jgi:16S rRNA processing protein RimM
MTLVRIGRIGRAHGLKGEVTLDGCSLDPGELQTVGTFEWRGKGGAVRPLAIESVRPMNHRLLVRFQGVDDREDAAELGLGELFADSERLPDPGPGMSYTFQLVGLRVVTDEGRELGRLEDVLATGANPVYVVQGERELLVPASPEVLQRVDLAEGVIVVRLPAGLEEAT